MPLKVKYREFRKA